MRKSPENIGVIEMGTRTCWRLRLKFDGNFQFGGNSSQKMRLKILAGSIFCETTDFDSRVQIFSFVEFLVFFLPKESVFDIFPMFDH